MFLSTSLYAQNINSKKEIHATKTIEQITIDGKLNEPIWELSELASCFIQYFPEPGSPANKETQVKILFDDEALYIAAKLYDDMDEIAKNIAVRDEIGISDWFGVSFDTYMDGQNGFEFIVTAAGVQQDIIISSSSRTNEWDAIWESRVHHASDHWSIEMKIPFNAIRFSTQEIQKWHINFIRQTQRDQEKSYWNPVAPVQFGILLQSGVLHIDRKIKKSLNLSMMSYNGANYINNNFKNHSFSQAGSLDLKYGLNNAFTIDVQMIPNLNYHVRNGQLNNGGINYNLINQLHRQFQTEGYGLFSNSNTFSPRRTSYSPAYHPDFSINTIGQLVKIQRLIPIGINAVKLSGRTNKGTGIGFYNAMTAPTIRTTKDVYNNEIKNIVKPLTNYNVIVIDQNLPNASNISLINTNVIRNGEHYDANVTSIGFDLKNKNVSWSIEGDGALSQQWFIDRTNIGHKLDLSINKISGNWNLSLRYREASSNYSQSDLSFFRESNRKSYSGLVSYSIFSPRGKINKARISLKTSLVSDYLENNFDRLTFENWIRFSTKKLHDFRFYHKYLPWTKTDFSQLANLSGIIFVPSNYFASSLFNSNPAKQFSYTTELDFSYYQSGNAINIAGEFITNIRLTPQVLLGMEWSYRYTNNHVEFIDAVDQQYYFFKRSRTQFNAAFTGRYSFNKNMTLTTRLAFTGPRQDNYIENILLPDGTLAATDLNFFKEQRIDRGRVFGNMVFQWRFAQGSDMHISFNQYHSQIILFSKVDLQNFDYLFKNSFDQNMLSFKITHYVDARNVQELAKKTYRY